LWSCAVVCFRYFRSFLFLSFLLYSSLTQPVLNERDILNLVALAEGGHFRCWDVGRC
jgi:hypothetical protein